MEKKKKGTFFIKHHVFAQGQVLWEHIVDTERKYTFPVEMEVTVVFFFLFRFLHTR